MRIVQINITYGHGSTGVIAQLIANMLEANGDEAYVAYDGYNNYHARYDYPIGNKWAYRIHAKLFTKLMDKEGFGSYLSTKGLCRWLDDVKPDILHLHNIHGSYINIAVLFKYIYQHHIPVVMTLHDCWTMTGHCYHFDAIGCERWKTGCHDCPLHRVYPISIGPDRSKSNYRTKKKLFTSVERMHIVSVSKFIDNAVSLSYLKKYPHTVIYNGIDLNVFKPGKGNIRKKLEIPPGKKILLGVSSCWSKEKGLNEMILLSRDERFQVILIGVQNDLIKQLPKDIIAIKRTENQKQLAEYYSMADVFVNPTYNDSFPTVNIESLACGTPVVTYQTGGSPEAIDERTGIVVERGNVNALLEAILEIIGRDRSELRQICRERSIKLFDQSKSYLPYLDIYNQLYAKYNIKNK